MGKSGTNKFYYFREVLSNVSLYTYGDIADSDQSKLTIFVFALKARQQVGHGWTQIPIQK